MLKDAKPIFECAIAKSEAKIVERILVSVLPDLLAHNIHISLEMIETQTQILLPDALFERVKKTAEQLTGISCDASEA